jgi:hypothetical protein
MNLALTIIGVVFGFLCIMIAIYQTLRYQQIKNILRKIERAENAEMWMNIGIIVRIFDSLEKAANLIMKRVRVDNEVLSEVTSAKRGISDQYLSLLKEAVLAESHYNMAVIEKWVTMGRLENEWRKTQAKRLLTTENMQNNS